MNIKLTYLLFFLLLPHFLVAQDCKDEIEKAYKLFDNGIFREAEKITKRVLDSCELDKGQRNEMLKLMASIYYEMDELELAEEYVAKFVKKNPNYIPSNKKDSHHFKLAFDKIKSWPRFSIGLRFGSTLGLPNALKIYPNSEEADYSKEYTSKLQLTGAIDFSWNISNFVTLNFSPGYRKILIKHEVPLYDNQLVFNYEEECNTAYFPIMIMGTIPFNDKFYLSLGVGGELSYFLDGGYSYFYNGSVSSGSDISYFLDLKNDNGVVAAEERNQLRFGALASLRFSYRKDRFTFFLDTRYIKEFSKYTKEGYKYYNPDLYLLNNYAVADLEISNIDFSIGVQYNFAYKVKSKY